MKKYLAMMMIAVIGCFLFMGCLGEKTTGPPVTENKVLKTANAIYLDIRTIVTDPEVKPMFTDKELDRMAELEQEYLEAAKILRAFPDDAGAIDQLSWVATEILYTINAVKVEKYRPYVAAIRISIKLLRNHI